MKRRILLLPLLLVMVVLLSACLEIQADMGVDGKNSAYLIYRIRLNEPLEEEERESLDKGIKALITHYVNELDFTLEGNPEAEKLDIRLVKRVQGKSPADAFVLLKQMLTDPSITPFLYVQADATETEYETGFTFLGRTDLGQIISTAHLEGLPPDIRQKLEMGIAESTGHFSITLPATSVITNSGEVEMGKHSATVKAPFTTTEPLVLELTTRLSTTAKGKATGGTMETRQNRLSGWIDAMDILRVVAAIFLILGAAIVTLWITHPKNKGDKEISLVGEEDVWEDEPTADGDDTEFVFGGERWTKDEDGDGYVIRTLEEMEEGGEIDSPQAFAEADAPMPWDDVLGPNNGEAPVGTHGENGEKPGEGDIPEMPEG